MSQLTDRNIKQQFLLNTALWMLAILLFVLLLVKAVCTDITHDEAYSFYNVKHFWWVETLCTGNTHWFNFLAIKTAVLFGFEKAWQIRWLSLLSGLGLIVITIKWLREFKNLGLIALAFSVFLCNPYLIDYLALARGYAFALFLQVLSLVSLYKFYLGNQKALAHFSLGLAGLSAVANFNFFYFFAAYAIMYVYLIYLRKIRESISNKWFYIDLTYVVAISLLVLKALWFIKDCSNDIGAYGGHDFMDATFSGFIKGYVQGKIIIGDNVLNILCYVIFTLVLLACLYGLLRFKQHKHRLYLTVSGTVLLMFLLSVINKQLFQVLYPIDRTTLMYFPLWIYVIVMFVSQIKFKSRLFNVVLYLLSFLFILNLYFTYNNKYPFDYPEQQDAKLCFKMLDSLGAKKVGIAPELFGVYRNYYQMTEHEKFKFDGYSIKTYLPNSVATSAEQLSQFDYLALYPPYNLSYYKHVACLYKLSYLYTSSGVLVLKKN